MLLGMKSASVNGSGTARGWETLCRWMDQIPVSLAVVLPLCLATTQSFKLTLSRAPLSVMFSVHYLVYCILLCVEVVDIVKGMC